MGDLSLQERSYRQPVWLHILGSLTAIFLLYEIVINITGLVYYAVDPTTRTLRQSRNSAEAQAATVRSASVTVALVAGEIVLLSGLTGTIVIGLKWLNRQTDTLRPNLHGLPAVREAGTWRVITPPTGMPAEYTELPPSPQSLLAPAVYTQPLDPRYLVYGHKPTGELIRSPLLDKGLVGVFGMTGTGKSEELAAIIVTAVRLWHEHAVPLELVVFDPKGADFYGRLPKLALMPYPTVKDPKDCLDLMQTLVADCETRQAELARAGAVSLAHYQQLGSRMPARVVIVDEVTETLIHMNSTQNARYVKAMQSLAQTGRSAGYRIFVASQRPAARQFPREVTGQLEGGRIVFRCDTDIESRMALGDAGAEKLPLTKGVMLYRSGAETVQGQAYFADLKYRFISYLQSVVQPAATQPDTVAEGGINPVIEGVASPVVPSDTAPLGRVEAAVPSSAVRGLKTGVPHDRPPAGEWEERFIWRAVERYGGIKPAQVALYPQGARAGGGKYFYWVRAAWARECKRRGLAHEVEHLLIPERYDK